MANWGRILSRGTVEDRRSFAPAVGGIGLTGVAVLFAVTMFLGGTPEDFLRQLQSVPVQQPVQTSHEFDGQDSYETFSSTVLGSANDMWDQAFALQGKSYTPPRLVLFRVATQSGCGEATADVGPHYCPLDQTIYLDETFFDELTNRFGAKGGDVAQAYVIAHEVGHHAQNQLMDMDAVQSNDASVKLELQADCYAGMWANSLQDKSVFEPNEIAEAIDAAAAVGDDRIQKKVQGYVSPETWTHGSSTDRVTWFTKGYDNGTIASCNTFQ